MNPNFNNLNNNMMNNFNNMNNMMMNLPNDNMNPSVKQQILNLINKNILMTEQISKNNEMIKSMIENSDFGNDNNKTDGPLKNFLDIDFFPGYDGQRINVTFDSSEIKLNMHVPLNVKIKDLIRAFHVTLQIYGKYVFKTYNILKIEDYSFIWNGSIVSINEPKTLFEYGMRQNFTNIIFYKKNNIIGG